MTQSYKIESGWAKKYPLVNMSRPHVDIEYNDDALNNTSGESAKNILLIGSAVAGQPNRIYELNSLSEARSAFQSGELVDACELIWNPANNGTQQGGTVYAIRAEQATNAKLVEGNLTFNSKVYGSVANGISVSMDKDIVTGLNRLHVYYDQVGYNKVYSNIGNVFSLRYKGTHTHAGYKVETGDNGATMFHLYADDTDGSTEVAKFDLTSSLYNTLYKLIDAIAKVPGFVVSITGESTSIDSKYLDKTDNTVDISSTKDSNTPVIVTAVVGDLLHKIRNDQYVSVTADLKTAFPEPFEKTSLSGAEDGEIPVSWAEMFTQARQCDVYYIVPLTDMENVHAELKEFLKEQDDEGYSYRAFVGGGYNESPQDSISRALALNDPRIALVANSGTYGSLDGTVHHVKGYMMSAYVAGIASSLPIGDSTTNKRLDAILSLDEVFTGDDLDLLDRNGVIAIEYLNNRISGSSYRVVEDVTTYTSQTDAVKQSVSLGEVVDFLLDELRIDLEDNYIGQSLRVSSASLLKSGVESFLDKKVSSGLIISYDETSISTSIVGNVASISFSCVPKIALRNIYVSATLDKAQLESTSFSTNTSAKVNQNEFTEY